MALRRVPGEGCGTASWSRHISRASATFSPALAPLSPASALVLLGDGYGHESRVCKHCVELEMRICAPCALLLGGRALWGVGSAASLGANTGLESEFARAGSVC